MPSFVQGPQKIDEPLAGRPAEIAGIDARDDDLALTGVFGDLFGFLHQVGDRQVAARTAGIVDRAVGVQA